MNKGYEVTVFLDDVRGDSFATSQRKTRGGYSYRLTNENRVITFFFTSLEEAEEFIDQCRLQNKFGKDAEFKMYHAYIGTLGELLI